MANMARPRLPTLHIRNSSTNSGDSDSSDTTPCPTDNEDTDYFMAHTNDSESSLGAATAIHDCDTEMDVEQAHRLTPISMLPPEILMTVISKLSTTADLRNCMLVSYHWALHTVGILWHRPLCNKFANLHNIVSALNKGSRAYFPYHEMVKRLNLSGLAEKVSDGTVQSFMMCKAIERLTLTNCRNLSDFGVSGLVDGCKKLQALDVTDVDSLTDRTLLVVARNCSKLQGLNITNCSSVTDESLIQIAQQCQQLKRLKLNGVFRATDASITAVAKHCRSILEIDLAGCQAITSESITALLTHLTHLRELRLAHCVEVTDAAFTNLPPRLQFDALRILDLTACEQIKDDAIAKIIPAAPRLRNLVLAKCRHITDRAVTAICKLTKNLHYIHLGHCTNLTDTAVIQLVKSCNRIRYIDLACCVRLTDASVRHLAQLPKLRRIGLVKCQNLTDSSIIALAHGPLQYTATGKLGVPSHFVSLERVHLSYCVNLTLKGITALLHNCPRLTHLSLTGVQAFLREDLTQFCRDAPAEFTHPQRDVFCVFSGEGVQRLRDYLMRLAMEEAEREGRDTADESLLDGVESPGADTMSDDGTIDGNDQHGTSTTGMHPQGVRISSHQRPRPRSMHELTFHNPNMPLLTADQLRRLGDESSPSDDVRTVIGSAPSHFMSPQQPYAHAPSFFEHRSRSPELPPLFDLGLDPQENGDGLTRAQRQRHSMQASSPAALFASGLGFAQSTPGVDSPQSSVEGGYGRFSNMPVGIPVRPDTSRRSNSMFETFPPQHVNEQRYDHLRPNYEVTSFDADRAAILSTIPGMLPLSPTMPPFEAAMHPPRTTSRLRFSDLLGSFQGQYPPPPDLTENAGPSATTELTNTNALQAGLERHREAMLRALARSEARQTHQSTSVENMNRPGDTTPGSVATSEGGEYVPTTTFVRNPQDGRNNTTRSDRDVTMTQ